eukprot:CAMPEP_0113467986 /NCGR_PEP_ID=MMETSP0014_2-20120614/15104_1 /TAXON_ID=2857 /ORGANISM="Nitzschia sp." /LENGTH=504 /DNA_ID=CAMNT_0000360325 /DNA_START=1052 /DNA_END=2566 /DNA_ORIENTATION=- /assembly_acc=CAM_ASM_000159
MTAASLLLTRSSLTMTRKTNKNDRRKRHPRAGRRMNNATSIVVVVAVLCCSMAIIFTSLGSSEAFTTTTTTMNTHKTIVIEEIQRRRRGSLSSSTTKTDSAASASASASALHVSSSPLYYEEGNSSDDTTTITTTTTNFNRNAVVDLEQQQEEDHHHQQQHQVSMRLVNSILFNQMFVLFLSLCVTYAGSFLFGYDMVDLHWNGDGGANQETFKSLFMDWNFTPLRISEGILAAMPMIALSHRVETSEQRDAMEVNFSTVNMVLSLFGRRKSKGQDRDPTGSDPSEVMALSCGVGVATGVSEEIIFRGLLPSFIYSLSHSTPVAMAGQAALFATGHLSPHAKPDENRLVGLLQFANGLWYGIVYVALGGDLLPCIIAHMLYDVHTLCGTYQKSNDQMDYTEQASRSKSPEWEQRAIEQMQQDAKMLGSDTVEFARRFFFAFDEEKVGSLSRNDVQKAICYAFLQDEVIPDKNRIDELFDQLERNDRMSFPHFLKMLLVLRSASI